MLTKFVEDFFISLFLGLLIGLTISYMTKRMRFIAQNVVVETVLMIGFALTSYFLSETF